MRKAPLNPDTKALLAAAANLEAVLRAVAARLDTEREFLRFVCVASGDEIRLVAVDDVCYLQSEDKYTRIVTREHESLIRKPIAEFRARLDPRHFWPIHRGTIVNVHAVAGVVRDVGGRLHVKLKHRRETLAVSEPHERLFKPT